MIKFRFFKLGLFAESAALCLKPKAPRKSILRYCTNRRAVLYVPGNDRRKIDKSLSMKVDCLTFDFDMSVIKPEKEAARTTVKNLLNEGYVTDSDPEWCIRINNIFSGKVIQADLDAILTANKLPPAIALPGVYNPDHLHWFAEQIWKRLIERPEDSRGPLKLHLVIGSTNGIMRLREICQKAQDLATMAPIIPAALMLDSDSLVYNLGGSRTSHGLEYLYARQKLVLTAKAFGLQAIDILNRNPLALKELQNECREGVCMGFNGKQVIHPIQVQVVQDEFSLTRTKIKQAQLLISEFNEREEDEKETPMPEETSIPFDETAIKLAKQTLELARLTGKIKEETSERKDCASE